MHEVYFIFKNTPWMRSSGVHRLTTYGVHSLRLKVSPAQRQKIDSPAVYEEDVLLPQYEGGQGKALCNQQEGGEPRRGRHPPGAIARVAFNVHVIIGVVLAPARTGGGGVWSRWSISYWLCFRWAIYLGEKERRRISRRKAPRTWKPC